MKKREIIDVMNENQISNVGELLVIALHRYIGDKKYLKPLIADAVEQSKDFDKILKKLIKKHNIPKKDIASLFRVSGLFSLNVLGSIFSKKNKSS